MSRVRIWVAGILLVLLGVAVVVSLLPLLETNIWWIRFLDFPRLQFMIVLVVLLLLFLAVRGRSGWTGWTAIVATAVALGYHIQKLYPFTDLAEQSVLTDASCAQGQSLRIMSANVKRRNESADVFLDQVATADPDVLLVLETDAWWDDRLSVLADTYPYRVQSIPEDHAFYGMHLLSKLELISPDFRFLFDGYTPTVFTQLRLPGGDDVDLIGMHPRPPHPWSQPTTMRDAHLLSAALEARASDTATILAGDFNAVPWERVTRRAIRIGGLVDPRIGRGLFPTYDTKSVVMSWPLDHILFQPQFSLQSFETLPEFGSDHRAVVATLCHQPAGAAQVPDLRPSDLAEAEESIEAATRLEQ
ncbi:MAG: endonuclease/exonuclease/phosphatase family protein [Paracoccus sp. (in: a-proteobacteria)]|uniref:endonuclease/exonuclease/phosphatase family protein n=1 Tax=Paracoccus sp. TaxID=267 RepID=UPI002E83B015|nr:endonuclease/exonuclease/phosphatase family protein [Pseudomonadota bacterium]